MYLEKDLLVSKYFSNILKKNKIEYILDPLTGLVNRKYMLDFIKYLIDKKLPFSMAILDLDFFKNINDKNGHSTGDFILESVGSDLIKYIGKNGLAGRFGGDEFIIVVFGDKTYDELHDFYDGMFHNENLLRKRYVSKSYDIFVTGTLGSASYPTNALNYEDLFLMADKTLYRGKEKGRNCYIIYVHEKHKDLQIQKMYMDDEATILFNINSIFEDNDEFDMKMKEVTKYLSDTLKLDNIFYIDKYNNLYDTINMEIKGSNIDISNVKYNNELHKTDYRGEVDKMNFGPILKDYSIASTLTTRIRYKDNMFGYLIFAQKRTAKIWENDQISILMYLSKMITLELLLKENNK